MKLKVSSVTNLTDARYFAAAGAHYLGFCFDALQPGSITLEKAKEISGWLHNITLTGEFGSHQPKEEIEYIARELKLQEIQVPIDHPQRKELSFHKFLALPDWRIIEQPLEDELVVRIEEKELNDPQLKKILLANKVFIEMDFTRENILPILSSLQPYGIQVTCTKEARPGLSAVDEYSEWMELLEL